jgi:hypothetical protein
MFNPVQFYEFGKSRGDIPNTFIGGVSASIGTAQLLATKLAINVSRITNFSVIGSDIECAILGSYVLVGFGYTNTTGLTYYRDNNGLVSSIGFQAFYGGTLVDGYFPNATSVQTSAFDSNITGASKMKRLYIPRVLTIGNTVTNDAVMRWGSNSVRMYVHPSLATVNSGGLEGDLASVATSATITYVTNFTALGPITDLTSGTIYSTAVQLNFTAPSSTNSIDYYECYANGVLKNRITASGQYIAGLTNSTIYNITIIAVDVFYNKSAVSNSVLASTSTTSAVDTAGLVSYYTLESSLIDGYGTNNGVGTSVAYEVGKIGDGVIFKGSSQISLGNPASLQLSIGTVACWIKTTSAGSSYRGIIGKRTAYLLLTKDGILGTYNWGSFGGGGDKLTGVNINDGLWHHVAMVFESGTANNYIFLDGVNIYTFSWSVGNQNDYATIGSGGGETQFINGTIDEAVIYNTKLSQTKITQLYNNGNGITL